ncbi:DUF4365 domain-containing protein [Leptospira yasudae]|uniref:DUF4365 domain-containing protein n=1 Tax=Leptospira yasudae TaxID=2202201 RepID=UPI001C4F2FAB|nr:DUF4365 domain-containing protein [Leptospira yasudae]MBW0434919.1 DUF4365 domain-containing protein [Leptospira yasudae]
MNFPKRIQQHLNQSKSFAILLYKLKDLGIFRNLTENDYGIDFEIERIDQGEVKGNYIKAQVKSSEDLLIRKDNTPTIGGIRQTTLSYWAELSYRTHVILFAVDLKEENIFYTKPIFWQAVKLLDNTEKTKTIEFEKAILPEHFSSEKVDVNRKASEYLTNFFIHQLFDIPSLQETIHAHKSILQFFNEYAEMYEMANRHDPWCELYDHNTFKILLDHSKILLYNIFEFKKELSEDEKHLFNFDYWQKKDPDCFTNHIACQAFEILIPRLLKKLTFLRNLVIESKLYWFYRNKFYLKLVYELVIPDIDTLKIYDPENNDHKSVFYEDLEVEIYKYINETSLSD